MRELSWTTRPFAKVYSPGKGSEVSQGHALQSITLKEHVEQEKGDAETKQSQ